MIIGIVTVDDGIMELGATIDNSTMIGDIGSADVKMIEYATDSGARVIKVVATGTDRSGKKAVYNFKFNMDNIKLVLEKEVIQEKTYTGVEVTGGVDKKE